MIYKFTYLFLLTFFIPSILLAENFYSSNQHANSSDDNEILCSVAELMTASERVYLDSLGICDSDCIDIPEGSLCRLNETINNFRLKFCPNDSLICFKITLRDVGDDWFYIQLDPLGGQIWFRCTTKDDGSRECKVDRITGAMGWLLPDPDKIKNLKYTFRINENGEIEIVIQYTEEYLEEYPLYEYVLPTIIVYNPTTGKMEKCDLREGQRTNCEPFPTDVDVPQDWIERPLELIFPNWDKPKENPKEEEE